MFDKLMQAQQMAGEIKKRLDSVSVTGEAEGGKIRVTATANKHITSISIDPGLLAASDHEELEELLAVAINKALDQADNVAQSETQAATKEMFGGLF